MIIKCWKCKEKKDESLFHKNRYKKFGVDCMCKECRNIYRRERTASKNPRGPTPRNTKFNCFKIKGNVVYKMYNSGGDVIYVGSTSNLGPRMSSHSSKGSFWNDVARVDVAVFENTLKMILCEFVEIAKHTPVFNTHTPFGEVDLPYGCLFFDCGYSPN